MYGWVFYNVEKQLKTNGNIVDIMNYETQEEAEAYIKRMLDTKSLDYYEKLVLVKCHYDNNRELIDEEILKEVA